MTILYLKINLDRPGVMYKYARKIDWYWYCAGILLMILNVDTGKFKLICIINLGIRKLEVDYFPCLISSTFYILVSDILYISLPCFH